MEQILFIASAIIALVSAVTVVTRRNPVYSAMALLPLIGSMALVFLLHQAPFVAAMQVMVYGGAVVVVFLFVIMLVALKPEDLTIERALVPKLAAGAGAVMLAGLLCWALLRGSTGIEAGEDRPAVQSADRDDGFGSVKAMAFELFGRDDQLTPYTVAFELISLLIVVAIIGAVMISKPEREASAPDGAEDSPESLEDTP